MIPVLLVIKKLYDASKLTGIPFEDLLGELIAIVTHGTTYDISIMDEINRLVVVKIQNKDAQVSQPEEVQDARRIRMRK